jgi:hypothetical protein
VCSSDLLIDPEDVHNGTAAIVGISRALLAMVVHNHQVAFGDHPLDVATKIGLLDIRRKPFDERGGAVGAPRVVLDVLIGLYVLPRGLDGLALHEGEVKERCHDLLGRLPGCCRNRSQSDQKYQHETHFGQKSHGGNFRKGDWLVNVTCHQLDAESTN